MRALWRLISALALFFGARRRFVRRLAGVCLLVLGVHAAADLLDDVVFRLVDLCDLVLDDAAAALIAWLSSIGGFSPDEAARRTEAAAALLDMAEKEWLALRLALLVELAVDLLLLDFAWGTREPHAEPRGLVAGVVDSARALRAAFRNLDLERLAVLPTLFCFCLGGSLVAARAVENAARDALAAGLPHATFATQAAASAALLASAVLLWRFLPDLLDGAILRAYERGEKAHERLSQRADARMAPRFPRLARARLLLRQKSRGKALLLVALPLSIASLLAQSDLLGMLQRLGSTS